MRLTCTARGREAKRQTFILKKLIKLCLSPWEGEDHRRRRTRKETLHNHARDVSIITGQKLEGGLSNQGKC
ncbi:hypothetical protein UPYG_G00265020 [Umbra pygmaea]|uniref:Uncharacterized protein n=1 Tax=Umbra pygmaea TaxID=75934 RepID=A0ABD0WU02_UMBPY